jgi:hypothetical protein
MCIITKIPQEVKTKKWDGEEEAGYELGPEEDPTVIYHPGKGPVGSTEEARAGIYTDPTEQHPN